jgi:hypothetical protein
MASVELLEEKRVLVRKPLVDRWPAQKIQAWKANRAAHPIAADAAVAAWMAVPLRTAAAAAA